MFEKGETDVQQANHPLSGKDLTFELQLVSIQWRRISSIGF